MEFLCVDIYKVQGLLFDLSADSSLDLDQSSGVFI